MKNKEIKNIKTIILISVIIVLIMIAIIVITISKGIGNEQEFSKTNTIKLEEIDEHKEELKDAKYEKYMERIKNATERDRIEAYAGKFFTYINDKNYEAAYDLLSDGFKSSYFRELSVFEEYVKTSLPKRLLTVEYDNIERNGNLYILSVKIIDPINAKSEDDYEEKYVIIEEYDYDNFKMSFSV